MSSVGKMTPGPWEATLEQSGRDDAAVHQSGTGQVVALCNAVALPMAERQANARAIAALPDLVEALREIKLAGEEGEPIDELVAISAAALAKLDAEGGAA